MPRFQARSADTDAETEAVHLELLRRAGPARRLRMALDLSAQVLAMARRAVRRNHPHATEAELDRRYLEQVYGRELADQVHCRLAREGR